MKYLWKSSAHKHSVYKKTLLVIQMEISALYNARAALNANEKIQVDDI